MRLIAAAGTVLAGALVSASACSSIHDIPEPPPTDGPFIPGVTCFDAGVEAPDAGPVITATAPPPPISGGTLAIMSDGTTAVAADPDRDVVWVVNLATRAVRHRVALQLGDEPGRLAEDDAGRVHVLLRRGGAVASIDLASGAVLSRRSVCESPRGIAFDSAYGLLRVACASGELLSLPPEGAVSQRWALEPDLRDVALENGRLVVSRFRSAEILTVSPDGLVEERREVPDSFTQQAVVNWRTVPFGADGLVMSHQMAALTTIDVSTCSPNPAYKNDSAISVPAVVTGVTIFTTASAFPVSCHGFRLNTLPVDVAVSPSRSRVVLAAAGDRAVVQARLNWASSDPPQLADCAPSTVLFRDREAIAVAITPENKVVAFTREPSLLIEGQEPLALPDTSRDDTGHQMFHRATSASVACASCHPEGTHDGVTWRFSSGLRRTQTIGGGILSTAPFHWTGDLPTMTSLMVGAFSRMGAPAPNAARGPALEGWMDTVPAARTARPQDPAQVARGRDLFFSAAVGCAQCHSGSKYTNNQTVVVSGSVGSFQVPHLMGLADRAPYFHDGSAATLRSVLTRGHGATAQTSQLSAPQMDDLVAFLNTL
jgi:mono/diheme cytochrome c family protein